jgi:hypothetical protein
MLLFAHHLRQVIGFLHVLLVFRPDVPTFFCSLRSLRLHSRSFTTRIGISPLGRRFILIHRLTGLHPTSISSFVPTPFSDIRLRCSSCLRLFDSTVLIPFDLHSSDTYRYSYLRCTRRSFSVFRLPRSFYRILHVVSLTYLPLFFLCLVSITMSPLHRWIPRSHRCVFVYLVHFSVLLGASCSFPVYWRPLFTHVRHRYFSSFSCSFISLIHLAASLYASLFSNS